MYSVPAFGKLHKACTQTFIYDTNYSAVLNQTQNSPSGTNMYALKQQAFNWLAATVVLYCRDICDTYQNESQ